MYAGEVYCGTIRYEAGKTKYTVSCGGLTAEHVVVTQPYQYLTLCEVQVFGEESDKG